MSDSVSTSAKKNPLKAISGAFKSAIPSTTGGKIIAGGTFVGAAGGGFVIGRLTKKAGGKK